MSKCRRYGIYVVGIMFLFSLFVIQILQSKYQRIWKFVKPDSYEERKIRKWEYPCLDPFNSSYSSLTLNSSERFARFGTERFRLSHPQPIPTPFCSQKGYYCFLVADKVPKASPFLDFVPFFCYWRSNLSPFERKQVAAIRSFFATQDEHWTSLTLYSDQDLSSHPLVKQLIEENYPRFSTKIYNPLEMAKGTVLEHWNRLNSHDEQAYPDSDLFRLLVLFQYGGVYFDMDTLLIRDLSPLLDEEFVMEWTCDKRFRGLDFFDNSVIRFFKGSKPLEDILLDIRDYPPGHTNWGGNRDTCTNAKVCSGASFTRVYYRWVTEKSIPPFNIIPWCFFDPGWCGSGALPPIFSNKQTQETRFVDWKLNVSFAYHWHNNYQSEVAEDSIFATLEHLHQKILDVIPMY